MRFRAFWRSGSSAAYPRVSWCLVFGVYVSMNFGHKEFDGYTLRGGTRQTMWAGIRVESILEVCIFDTILPARRVSCVRVRVCKERLKVCKHRSRACKQRNTPEVRVLDRILPPHLLHNQLRIPNRPDLFEVGGFGIRDQL